MAIDIFATFGVAFKDAERYLGRLEPKNSKEGVTLTPALAQWLADGQIQELQPTPLRSMAGSPQLFDHFALVQDDPISIQEPGKAIENLEKHGERVKKTLFDTR